jgi:group II intron reverse transcriptase/maturase
MSRQLELPIERTGEARTDDRSGEAPTATHGNERSGTDQLIEQMVARDNCIQALRRVRKNKGSPGMDGMSVTDLSGYLAEHWPRIREDLLAGRYEPKPVLRCEIPKANGGVRQLGIPCAIDRFIQQALLQVLQPRFDPTFSEHSYGFRPGRNAHQAVRQAAAYLNEGRHWVVDVDLEKFFDRVNHDVLMGRLARRIEDKRVLKLIRCFLNAGIMAGGVVIARAEGTPQGGPLSPLLANVLLDEVDKELERRGLAFVRYADDCNVYVRSERAGEDAMALLRRLFTKLRLRVNDAKSAVARPDERKLLGYSFEIDSEGAVWPVVAKSSIDRMKDRVRASTSRKIGRSLRQVIAELRSYMPGWKQYFRLAETPRVFETLDGWIRRRLRALQMAHWKNGRTIARELRARGVRGHFALAAAKHAGSWWRMSRHTALQSGLPNSYFDANGLPRLAT